MRGLFLNHLGLKLISLILATLLWFIIHSSLQQNTPMPASPFSPTDTREMSCPVRLLVPPNRWGALQVEPGEVIVKFSGDPDDIRKLKSSDIQAFVVLADAAPPQSPVSVEVHVPHYVRLVEVQPPEVRVLPAIPP